MVNYYSVILYKHVGLSRGPDKKLCNVSLTAVDTTEKEMITTANSTFNCIILHQDRNHTLHVQTCISLNK